MNIEYVENTLLNLKCTLLDINFLNCTTCDQNYDAVMYQVHAVSISDDNALYSVGIWCSS